MFGGQRISLGVGSCLPHLFRQALSCFFFCAKYYKLPGPQDSRGFSCLHLPLYPRSVGIRDVDYHIQLLTRVPGSELKLSCLHGEHFY